MANFWYVSSVVGTATVNTTPTSFTKLTGTFAAMTANQVFATINDVLLPGTKTTTVADGDIICAASTHIHDYGANTTTLAGPGGTTDGLVCHVIAVDADNADAFLIGALEQVTGSSADIILSSGTIVYGVKLDSEDDLIVGVSAGELGGIWNGLSPDLPGSGDVGFRAINFEALAISMQAIVSNATATPIAVAVNSSLLSLDWLGNTGTSLTSPHFLATGDGIYSRMYGSDFTGMDAAIDIGTTNAGAETSDCRWYGLRLPAPWTGDMHSISLDWQNGHHVWEMIGADNADEFVYKYKDTYGTIDTDNAVFFTASTAFADGTQISFSIDTTTFTNEGRPFIWKMPVKFLDLSSSKTITLNFAVSLETLNLDDIGMVIGYPNSTNPNILEWKTTYPSMGSNPLIPDRLNISSTTFTDIGSGWDGTVGNKYSVSLTISDGHANPALAPVIFLFVFKELTSQVLFVASELIIT